MLYFAYGSNLYPHRLPTRVGPARQVDTGAAPGFRLTFSKRGMDGTGKCHLARGDCCAYGTVFELTPEQFLALDRFEGPGYRRRTIRVNTLDGDLTCTTYLARRHWIRQDLRPAEWYRNMVLIGAYSHGFPGPYLRRIQSWPCRRNLLRDSRDGVMERVKSILDTSNYDDWVPF